MKHVKLLFNYKICSATFHWLIKRFLNQFLKELKERLASFATKDNCVAYFWPIKCKASLVRASRKALLLYIPQTFIIKNKARHASLFFAFCSMTDKITLADSPDSFRP